MKGKAMKRKFVSFAILMLTLAVGAVALAQPSTIKCVSVGTSSTQLLPTNNNRFNWTIATTSGAPAVWWNLGAAAVAHGQSMPLPGGGSFTEDGPEAGKTATGALNAVSLSTSWVCVKATPS